MKTNPARMNERLTHVVQKVIAYRPGILQYLSRNETDIKIDNALVDGIIHHIYLIGIHKSNKIPKFAILNTFAGDK